MRPALSPSRPTSRNARSRSTRHDHYEFGPNESTRRDEMCNHYSAVLIRLFAALILMSAGAAASAAGQTIKPDDMGLSKESVFAVPTPKVYSYGTAQPGEGKALPRAYKGAPPQISHDIGEF